MVVCNCVILNLILACMTLLSDVVFFDLSDEFLFSIKHDWIGLSSFGDSSRPVSNKKSLKNEHTF